MQFRRRLGAWLASAASAGLLACPQAVLAQSAPLVSRPVVQGLPGAESQRLNLALARLARDPRDYSALIDAGEAANAMGDPEAAAGFYTRADGIAPGNPRIKAGLARALVLQGKPTEAIPLFASAEAGGVAVDVTSDRGLAYDLVGDPVTAQRYYHAALALRDEDEVRRRLGISLAITGDAAASDAMLMPLLRKQDKPAWRAHAFALAIAGKTKEAVDTVNAILPVPLAQSVTPYLRYMPRLTRSQQAAAVNLGKFPRASEIGRDDPAIAAYAPSITRVASADAGLIPRGKPLGSGRSRGVPSASQETGAPLTSSERRARDKAARLARAEAVQAARVAPPEPMPTIDRTGDGELPALATSTPMAPAATMAAPPAPVSRPPLPSASSLPRAASVQPPERQTTPAPRQALADPRPAGTAIVRTGSIPLAVAASPTTAPSPVATSAAPAQPSAMATPAPRQNEVIRTAAPGFDLATLGTASQVAPGPGGQTSPPAAAPPAQPSAAPGNRAVSLEQAFADLGAPSRAPAPIAGAVDVRAIEQAKPEPEPELAKSQTSKAETARADTTKLEARNGGAKKAGAARSADLDELPSDKKKVGSAKDAKLADAKLVDAKKGDPKKADAKKGDAKKAELKKAPPSHPSRIWVQVGVGRDKAAIGYDWRKFVKENPALFKSRQAYISDMGRTNRILTGPFESQKAAADLLAKLKKADVGGAFVWTSPAGQVVDPLAVK